MKRSTKIKLLFITGVFIFLVLRTYFNASKMLVEIGTSDFRLSMTNAVYDAMGKSLENESNFSELYLLKTDDSGNVVFVSADSYRLNLLANKIANETFCNYQKYADGGVEVPIGVFTGFRLFSALGSKVNLKLITMVSVECEFVSDFTEAGINQTRHTLYINVVPEYAVITNGRTVSCKEVIQVVCYDNLIVGKVPNTYLSAKVVGVGTSN